MPMRTRETGQTVVITKQVILALLCLLLYAPHAANGEQSCSPSRLSQEEARDLLKAIPQALAAKRIGGELSIVGWSPGANYRVNEFYFYQVLSTKSTTTTPLDNGVIGYFGVNKATAQVVELNSERPSVEGAELKKVQDRLRAKRCISRDLVRRYENMSLEK